MIEVREKPKLVERAFLVGITSPEQTDEHTELLLDELASLVETLEIGVNGRTVIHLSKPQPKLMVGKGKAEEILAEARALDCDVIIFDQELSPSQQRNWERMAEKFLVIDRQEIILDIFGERASTKEARLQIELARMEYSLPRLRRAWTHLGRQRGGVMQRGEGETQLEVDQRLVRKRIQRMRAQLEIVRRQRETQRKRRRSLPVPTGAIVGYTNAGKSSLLNALTESDVLAEDKLFATLDPTSRRLSLPNGQNLVLTDTVGFVRNLPHRLVEAFKATLEEAVVSDFLLHVVDVRSAELEEHKETTESVLEELHALDKPTVLVFNKIDGEVDPATISYWRSRYPEAHFVSARTGEGLGALKERMVDLVQQGIRPMKLLIPHDRYDLVHFLHEIGAVDKESYEDEGVLIRGNIPEKQVARVTDFALAGT
ncbi:GTPase HflX [Puniceicoccus vermicola]|uniref:GTPase HflX n=1 Tax=Puniceicoccus vermicola TaxID=388746 RepID=A0A7X1AX70_9BACT|nr:GTPase HflX [Puniceicoccus vermicola]